MTNKIAAIFIALMLTACGEYDIKLTPRVSAALVEVAENDCKNQGGVGAYTVKDFTRHDTDNYRFGIVSYCNDGARVSRIVDSIPKNRHNTNNK